MSNSTPSYVFGEYRIEPGSRRILREDGTEIHMPKRPLDVLLFLIENRSRIVCRDELLDLFWDGCDVYDDALRKCVGSIRKSLGDNQKPPRFIETRYGDGYRFIGDLETLEEREKSAEGNGLQTKKEYGDKRLSSSYYRPRRRYVLFLLVGFSIAGLLLFGSFGFFNFPSADGGNRALQNGPEKGAEPPRSLAVLPLKNLTGDPANEYFSDGVTESVITELSRIGELRVVSRGSTFAFKGKDPDPLQVGHKLNVDALLEGNIRKKDGLLSVNVRLVSARDGSILWTSRDFERPLDKAYELQDTIACNVAIELRTKLCDTGKPRNTSNADAYEAYQKGRFQWNKRTAEGIRKSIEFYQQAISSDGNYAPAYAGLAESYVQGIWHVPFDAKEVLPKAKEAAFKAIELDDTLAEAHTALAGVYLLEWNWPEAERGIQRAIELNPRYARARHVNAFICLTLGRNEEAIAEIETARELDPLNLVINTDKAVVLSVANRNEEAFRQWEKTLELDPGFALAYEHRSATYELLGNESDAIRDRIKEMELNEKPAVSIAEYRLAAKYGLKALYQKELNNILAREKRGEKVSLIALAILNSLLGQKDAAFKYLQKACDERIAEMVLVKTAPQFGSLRFDPRFRDLERKMGLPE